MAKLPPLPEEAFEHGYKEKAEINLIRCKHEPQIISGTEMKCNKCGNGWTGPNILDLYKAMKAY